MFNKEAIEALQYGGGISEASNAVRAAFAETRVVGLPSHFTLHDLEKFLPNRRRSRGLMETSIVQDFAEYVERNAEAGATVFVNGKSMTAVAVLNLGTPDAPGHADNRAHLKPEQTAAYKALRTIAQGHTLSQVRVAEFLEDWAPHIICFKDDEELPLKRAIAAVRNITIEGLRKVEASEHQLSSSKSTFESIAASSKDTLPTNIHFHCEPYHGFDGRLFVIRIGIHANDKPSITMRIVNYELHEEQMAKELAEKVRSAVDACPVLIGEYMGSN
ncbi:MAG: DUF2303 family protein [Rhodocyclaceae bacterium]